MNPLYDKLNHAPEHERYWGGRADVHYLSTGEVEVVVSEQFKRRVPPIMEAEGYVLVSEAAMDVGDEDCPKWEAVTRWVK